MEFKLTLLFDKPFIIQNAALNASIKIVESIYQIPKIYVLLEDSFNIFYKELNPKIGTKANLYISNNYLTKISDVFILQNIKTIQSRFVNSYISNLYSLELTLDSEFYTIQTLYKPNPLNKDGYIPNSLGFIIENLLRKIGFSIIHIEPILQTKIISSIYIDSKPLDYLKNLLREYDDCNIYLNINRKAYVGSLDFLKLNKKPMTIYPDFITNYQMFDAKMLLNLDYSKFKKYNYHNNYSNNEYIKQLHNVNPYNKYDFNKFDDDIFINTLAFESHKIVFSMPLNLDLHIGDLIYLKDFDQKINGYWYIETIIHNFDIAEQSFIMNTEISINRKEVYNNGIF